MSETTALLDQVDRLLGRFVAFPSEHERHAAAAWVLHAWVVNAFDSTPRLAVMSPEKGSGKTRLLEVLELVVPHPERVSNASESVLFRLLGGTTTTTLLFDEVDTIFGRYTAKHHEPLRGIINAGHRRGATVKRVNAEAKFQVETYEVFAPVALAGIGQLPDTIHDRSIIINMRRRTSAEPVEQFRFRRVKHDTVNLAERLEAWSQHESLLEELENLTLLMDDGVSLPDGLADRAADVWEPLLLIALAASGDWQRRLWAAAEHLNAARAEADDSLGIDLLRDIRQVLASEDRIASSDLAQRLRGIEGARWADYRGTGLDANALAKLLKAYGVRPLQMRFGERTQRGYSQDLFADAFARYVDTHSGSGTPGTSGTPPQPVKPPAPAEPVDVPDVPAVPAPAEEPDPLKGLIADDPREGPIALAEAFASDPWLNAYNDWPLE